MWPDLRKPGSNFSCLMQCNFFCECAKHLKLLLWSVTAHKNDILKFYIKILLVHGVMLCWSHEIGCEWNPGFLTIGHGRFLLGKGTHAPYHHSYICIHWIRVLVKSIKISIIISLLLLLVCSNGNGSSWDLRLVQVVSLTHNTQN